MTPTFEKEMEFLYEYAKATLQQTGKMLPMAVLIGPNGRKVIGLSWANDDEKEKMVTAVKLMIALEKIHTWMFASEMWIALHIGSKETMRPARTYPEREEGILVNGRERGKTMTITVRFRRGKDGFHFHTEHRSDATDYQDILWAGDGFAWDRMLAARGA